MSTAPAELLPSGSFALGVNYWASHAATLAELRTELQARGEPYATALAEGRAVVAALLFERGG